MTHTAGAELQWRPGPSFPGKALLVGVFNLKNMSQRVLLHPQVVGLKRNISEPSPSLFTACSRWPPQNRTTGTMPRVDESRLATRGMDQGMKIPVEDHKAKEEERVST